MFQLIAMLNQVLEGIYISDLSFAALPVINGISQDLHHVRNSLYNEMSLTNDQYSRSTATAKQDNAYEILIPLLTLDGDTDEIP